MKAKREYRIVPNLPATLDPLRDLAGNLIFSWRSETRDLFKRMDPSLWIECGHNPVKLLGEISQERLDELSHDMGFLAQMQEVAEDLRKYLTFPRQVFDEKEAGMRFVPTYFSAEFGLTSCVPIYSGGLGILAGDHLKSASDLNIPLVAVGLLYQEGYFSQYLSADGWQMETYPVNDFSNMPITQMRDASGAPLRVSVNFKERQALINIWRADVGRVPLYLLDTNMEENPEDIRQTTAQLYGGDREMRLRQEIVLGIGGVRALRAMGIVPTVVHMNEGHSAFSALERINMLRKENGLSFDEAREVVQASTVFTTHTPVPAGNDTFDPGLVISYFNEYAKELGINIKVLLGYGRVNPRDEGELFGVTPLALRLSAHANGVSRLHGEVSRAMWRDVWPRNPEEDIPIDYVTNGIHVPTWISRDIAYLFNRYLGPNWNEDPDNEKVWEQVEQIPTTELWRAHVRCREALVGFARRLLAKQLDLRGATIAERQVAYDVLSADALTIGFARRFATYKRATLLFRDPDRLDKIINNPERPVQIILAGKAHPQDNEGKEFIKQIIHLARQDRFRNRIVFLEDYNMRIAHVLLSGADVWLNTPRRPLEACGTSGMKAMANGALNLSVLDGWWDEGYHRDFGWAIGHGEQYQDLNFQDETESRDLYNLLEKQVVPLFYDQEADGIPRGWVAKMRAGLRRLAPVFNAHRMVQDYSDRFYVPCSKRYSQLTDNNMAGAREMTDWRRKMMTNWNDVSVLGVGSTEGQECSVGSEIEVSAKVVLGKLEPADVTVEAYYGRLDHRGEFADRECSALEPKAQADGVWEFTGKVPCQKTGRFGFTVRVTPSHEKQENPFVMGLVCWA